MDLVDPGRPDPRLPDGVPNFASHKITIPSRFKPAHWRYKDVEVDARFRLPSHRIILGLEYDGVYHHSNGLRERSGHEAEKSKVLKEAGVVATVVHVRVGTLPPLQAPHALTVSVPEGSTPYEQACAVAAAIEARYPGSIPKLAEYLASGRARGQAQADAYILATWGQLRPPRPKPQRTTPPRQRQLKADRPTSRQPAHPHGEPVPEPGTARRDTPGLPLRLRQLREGDRRSGPGHIRQHAQLRLPARPGQAAEATGHLAGRDSGRT